jgi:hypothetical protein
VSVLWIIPLLFVAAGAAFLGVAVRRMAEATVSLRQECDRLEELRVALVDLQTEVGDTRAMLEDVGSRSNLAPRRG